MDFSKIKNYHLWGFSSISLGNIGSSIIGGLLWLFLATIMQVSDYGEISFYMSLGAVMGMLSVLGMNMVLLTYSQEDKDGCLFNQASSLILISSSIIAAVVSVFSWQTAFFILGIAYFSVHKHKILGSLFYKEYFIISLAEAAIRFSTSILFFFMIGPLGIILAFGVSQIALSYRFFKSVKHFSICFDRIRPKAKFAIHALGLELVLFLPPLLDKSIIIFLFNFETVGVYQLGLQFFSLVAILPVTILQFLLPKKVTNQISKRLISLLLILAIVSSVLFIFFSPLLIDTYFDKFVDAKFFVQIAGIAIIPSSVTAISNAFLFAKGKTFIVFCGGIIFLSTLLLSIVALGPAWQISGLAAAFVIAHVSQASFLAKFKFDKS